MVEALYVAVRVASFELVLAFLQQAHQRKALSLSLLQAFPATATPQHPA